MRDSGPGNRSRALARRMLYRSGRTGAAALLRYLPSTGRLLENSSAHPSNWLVLTVLDFQPRRDAAIALIRATGPFRHDALEVAFAGELDSRQPRPTMGSGQQSVGIQHAHDARKPSLPLDRRQATQILIVDREHIKRHEVRPPATEQQIVKLAPAIRTEAEPISPSSTALYARTACAISSASCGHRFRT